MSYRVIVTPTADAEAMEAFRWHAERSGTVADRWIAGLEKAIANPAENPGRFPVSVDDSEASGCEARLLLHGRRRGVRRIIYRIEGDTVWVLRIRHGARSNLANETGTNCLYKVMSEIQLPGRALPACAGRSGS